VNQTGSVLHINRGSLVFSSFSFPHSLSNLLFLSLSLSSLSFYVLFLGFCMKKSARMSYPTWWSPARGGSAAAPEAPNLIFLFFFTHPSSFTILFPLLTSKISKDVPKALNLEIKIRKFTSFFSFDFCFGIGSI